MLRSCLKAACLLALVIAPVRPGWAQLPVQDWTQRPDARSPAGISDDGLLAPRTFEVVYSVRTTSYEDILFGTDAVPPILILLDWDNVPIGMTLQRHEIEVRAGILDWLGASVRIPLQHTSVEFATDQAVGTPSSFGMGDIELRALYSLHDIWPYRAHLIGGVVIPSGVVNHKGELPGRPGVEVTLPYTMQPSDGTFALLPGAVLVAENESGTVGLHWDARIPIGDNGRNWTRGNEFSTNVWMAYRFTDWVSGSLRLHYRSVGNVDGIDVLVNPFGSPMGHPLLQGGQRLDVPVGVNILFPEGPLAANRISAEFVIPMHQDLDGPQIAANYGLAFTWGVMF